MVKFAFSTNAYKKHSLEDAISSIAALGYAGVEIMADVPHAYPPHISPVRIQSLKSLLEKFKLGISNVNAFTLFALGDTYHPSWIEADSALRRQRITHTLNCIEMAAALGAKSISLQPGGPLGTDDRTTGLDRYEAGLHEVLPAAQKHHIILTVEPEPGLLIETSTQCIEFLSRMNHPNLKMNCDLGHFFCVGEDPARVLENAQPWIAHIHLEDIREDRIHQHLIPGRGAMNWPAIFKAIRTIQYTGWVTVELYPYESTAEEAARAAIDFLQKFA